MSPLLSLVLLVGVLASPSVAQPVSDPSRDGRVYPATRVEVGYPLEHPDLPDSAAFDGIVVTLSRAQDAWIAPIEGMDTERVRLGDGFGATGAVSGSAVGVITRAIRDWLESEYGMIGHLVTPSPADIDFAGDQSDRRPAGQTTLTVFVWRAVVGDVRTIAYGAPVDGKDIDGVDRVNLARHDRIRNRDGLREGDLLRQGPLDRRALFLSRHPNRRVDVAIAPEGDGGRVSADYLVTESKPWLVYAEVSNTGTSSTSEWVTRFGAAHHQLTGADDILRIDYVTAGFEDSHAVSGSYERPVGHERLRARIHGGYNQYRASDVGVALLDFRGEGARAGGELVWNAYQRGPMFVDLVGGVRYEHTEVDNRIARLMGDSGFLLPQAGVRLERDTAVASTRAEVMVEWSVGGVPDTADLPVLGRPLVEDEFVIVRGSVTQSFYLEPILRPAAFRGANGPDGMTLAHEIVLIARGQSTLGDRVPPTFQQVAGGFYTVRGYDESVAVGDEAILFTAEYRFHLGSALPARSEAGTLFGHPFRWRRQSAYALADWDVIFRAFSDVGRVKTHDALSFERDETLAGAGVGVELRVRHNVGVRADFAWQLRGVGPNNSGGSGGDGRVHLVGSLLF